MTQRMLWLLLLLLSLRGANKRRGEERPLERSVTQPMRGHSCAACLCDALFKCRWIAVIEGDADLIGEESHDERRGGAKGDGKSGARAGRGGREERDRVVWRRGVGG